MIQNHKRRQEPCGTHGSNLMNKNGYKTYIWAPKTFNQINNNYQQKTKIWKALESNEHTT